MGHDLFAAAVSVAILAATPAAAETLRAKVAFNTAIQQKTAEQPADGVSVAYPVTLSSGELDGCTVQIVKSLYPRDEGAWGVFQVAGDVACDDGGFAFASSGAWDGNGFHGAGQVADGSGSGAFEGLSGRVAQIGGSLVPAAASGTLDVGYELLVDRAGQ